LVARKDQIGRPWAFSTNNISLINVFTLTNIDAKIVEGKLSKKCVSNQQPFALIGAQELARSFKKVGDPYVR